MGDVSSVLFHNPMNSGGGHLIKMTELMTAFVDRGTTVYHVSPSGFDEVEGVRHVPHVEPPSWLGFGFPLHLLSVLATLLLVRPDRFVPFTLYGGFVGAVASTLVPGLSSVVFIRGDTLASHSAESDLRITVVRRLTRCVEWVTFRRADRLVFISEDNRDRMLGRNGLDANDVEADILYNDLYTDRVTRQLAEPSKDLEGDPVVGFAGEFPANGGKGVQYLLKGTAEVIEPHPDLHLYLLGDGPQMNYLQALAVDLGIEDHVHFEGWVDDPIRYMQSFDLYVLPSLHEGLGNSLLEALASETPVAGSDVGGIPEVIGCDRLLFEPGDPAAIAEVISYVFRDEEGYEAVRAFCMERRSRFDFDWTERAIDHVQRV